MSLKKQINRYEQTNMLLSSYSLIDCNENNHQHLTILSLFGDAFRYSRDVYLIYISGIFCKDVKCTHNLSGRLVGPH